MSLEKMDFRQAVRERLVRTRAIVEAGWCQHDSSTVVDGKRCFSLTGAVWEARALDDLNAYHDNRVRGKVERLLHEAVEATGASAVELVKWNDVPGRTQAEVLAVIDQAIERAVPQDAPSGGPGG